ncbi:MAG TPA: vanadium-dependent haloperoxidase [Burkholderiaceae bacterium]|nr:vanadium-dependent haloperoxidase [Burkholderiaceae bacterium]
MTPTARALALITVATFALGAHAPARADAVTDWNARAAGFSVEGRIHPPHLATSMMASVQSAVFAATNAITKKYPASAMLDAAPGASVDAAVAAASRGVLVKYAPAAKEAIDRTYDAALASIADGAAKTAGIDVGERAAAAVLALRAGDLSLPADQYRPVTTAGTYVPTVTPLATVWPQRKPWLMSSAAQFRPGPPPDLSSTIWARDYNEIKAVGARNSTTRTAEQTAIAKFWEATGNPIYHSIVRSLADRPGRDITQNARLFAVVAQATDDALIAVMDAKYHYMFWRPLTAIRNGDIDGNDATERDPSWTPLIDTPMHPEYPCAHCILAGSVGAVLKAEIGSGVPGTLTSTNYLPGIAPRSWTSVDAMVDEVKNARIYDGVHYRNSTEVGAAMGRQIGELAAAKFSLGK